MVLKNVTADYVGASDDVKARGLLLRLRLLQQGQNVIVLERVSFNHTLHSALAHLVISHKF